MSACFAKWHYKQAQRRWKAEVAVCDWVRRAYYCWLSNSTLGPMFICGVFRIPKSLSKHLFKRHATGAPDNWQSNNTKTEIADWTIAFALLFWTPITLLKRLAHSSPWVIFLGDTWFSIQIRCLYKANWTLKFNHQNTENTLRVWSFLCI